jgi:hypothetical protein
LSADRVDGYGWGLALISAASKLLDNGQSDKRYPERPEVFLRRAVSTAYYGAFHALCYRVATCVMGGAGADVDQDQWRQVYRSVEHSRIKDAHDRASRQSTASADMKILAELFKDLRERRMNADYEPPGFPGPNLNWAEADEALHKAMSCNHIISELPDSDIRSLVVALWTKPKSS